MTQSPKSSILLPTFSLPTVSCKAWWFGYFFLISFIIGNSWIKLLHRKNSKNLKFLEPQNPSYWNGELPVIVAYMVFSWFDTIWWSSCVFQHDQAPWIYLFNPFNVSEKDKIILCVYFDLLLPMSRCPESQIHCMVGWQSVFHKQTVIKHCETHIMSTSLVWRLQPSSTQKLKQIDTFYWPYRITVPW